MLLLLSEVNFCYLFLHEKLKHHTRSVCKACLLPTPDLSSNPLVNLPCSFPCTYMHWYVNNFSKYKWKENILFSLLLSHLTVYLIIFLSYMIYLTSVLSWTFSFALRFWPWLIDCSFVWGRVSLCMIFVFECALHFLGLKTPVPSVGVIWMWCPSNGK